MRYPTRAFQSDTTVVSNDRRRHHRVSQTKAAPAPTGAAFTYPLDRSAYISGVVGNDRRSHRPAHCSDDRRPTTPRYSHHHRLGQNGDPLPVGAVRRIFVGNDMLFDGYTNAASPAIEDQLMDTGDLGYLDASGRLFVAGRDDEMIISGGENVFPRPVEEVIARLPQVADVAVVGVPDSEFGQRLAAFVVRTEGSSLDEEMVRGYVRNRLSRFSIPRDAMFVNQLPRTATGKILKRHLTDGQFPLGTGWPG